MTWTQNPQQDATNHSYYPDIQYLPGADPVIGEWPGKQGWVYNYGNPYSNGANSTRKWLRCGVQIVADASQSDENGLYLYAKVFDWCTQGSVGGEYQFYTYIRWVRPDGGQRFYGSSSAHAADWASSGQWLYPYGQFYWYSSNSQTPCIFKNTNSLWKKEWVTYFPLGYFSSGSASSGQFQTGVLIDSMEYSAQATASYTIQSITVSYDPHTPAGYTVGGTTPSSSRVRAWAGSDFSITVSQSGFSVPNHAFAGWSTDPNVAVFPDAASAALYVDYEPGDEYSGDSDITLYAVWYTTNKTLTYYLNKPAGVTGTDPAVPSAVTVPASTPSIAIDSYEPDGLVWTPPYEFAGWATSSSGPVKYKYDSQDYPGAYTGNTNVNLYAVWTTDYMRPYYTDIKVYRSDISGSSEPTQSYFTVSGTVVVDQTKLLQDGLGQQIPNVPQTLIATIGATEYLRFEYNADPSLSDFEEVVSPDPGVAIYKFEKTTGSGQELNAANSYTVAVEFKDLFMTNYPSPTAISAPLVTYYSLPVAYVTFSTSGQGKSAAFGQQAATTLSAGDATVGRLDVSMNAYFHGKVTGIPVDGTTIAYNGNDELSYIGQISSYTEDSGGTSLGNFNFDGSNWPTTYDYTRNGSTISGCGWREIKHAEGRLEKWVWGWQQGQSSSDTYHMSNNWRELPIPAGTDFSDTPNLLMTCRTSNTGVGVWATQQGSTGTTVGSWDSGGWTDGSSIGFSYTAYNHVGSAVAYPGKVLFQAYLDGHWQV